MFFVEILINNDRLSMDDINHIANNYIFLLNVLVIEIQDDESIIIVE